MVCSGACPAPHLLDLFEPTISIGKKWKVWALVGHGLAKPTISIGAEVGVDGGWLAPGNNLR